jgi:hypothetical protein
MDDKTWRKLTAEAVLRFNQQDCSGMHKAADHSRRYDEAATTYIYSLIKREYKVESYLLSSDDLARREWTWLRSDASLLAIQVLRGKDVPHNERIRSLCHNRTEIEEHLYNNCMALDPTWNAWKSEVLQHIPQTILVFSTRQRILSTSPTNSHLLVWTLISLITHLS